jgi:hypothetical protein
MFFDKTSAQVFRFRLGPTSGFFLTEPGDAEINHPDYKTISYAGAEGFTPGLKAGADLEIMFPVATDFELGVQFDYTNLSGRTETAPFYNFFISRYNPLPDTYKYPDEALIYKTKIFNILGTTRIYLLPLHNYMAFYLKAFGGISFVGTDFTFHDPVYRVQYDVGTLYSLGTLNSEDPKELAFNGGGGLGFTYKISERMDIFFESTVSFIHSDLVNGVPNFNFLNFQGEETLRETTSWSSVAKVSMGLIFTAIPDRRLNKGNYTRSRKFHKSLFWKNKSSRPWGKRRRR